MSERLHSGHEHHEQLSDKDAEILKARAEKHLEAAAEKAKDNVGEIDQILRTINKEARPAEQHTIEKDKTRDKDAYSHHQLTTQTYRQSIRSAQKKLPTPERVFSKFVHNPKVETTSEVVGNTIARPSGLLWGGLFSAIASVGVLIACRYYGFEYNFSIGLISFAGGYCVGLLVEAAVRIFRR